MLGVTCNRNEYGKRWQLSLVKISWKLINKMEQWFSCALWTFVGQAMMSFSSNMVTL